MPSQLSGYPANDSSKSSALKEITVTTSSNKSYLDVNAIATNLDIRDLTSTSDSVEVKQATGTSSLACGSKKKGKK